MKVLMSIKPEFAFKIFAGTKRFEFRRAVFKNKDIKTVIVYASAPIQQVIGEFEIEQILSYKPETLWKKTKKYSGISEEFFFEYFESKVVAHAIKIKSVKRYRQPLCLKSNFNVTPPQSFLYVPS